MRIIIVLFLLLAGTLGQSRPTPPFSFHILSEPLSLDPTRLRGTASSYLFSNLYRGLYRITETGLKPYGAKQCRWRDPQHLICNLEKRYFSNGQRIVAADYVRAFRYLIDPKNKSVQTELLLALKNARWILKNQKKVKSLGVKSVGRSQLHFFFAQKDPDFLYSLASPALAPLASTSIPSPAQAQKLITTGPYKIKEWIKGKKVELISNTYYPNGSRPPVQVYFIEDDNTALRFFQTKKLSFLRRVTTDLIPQFKNDPSFLQVPLARFDYIGFGPELDPYPNLRKALVHSLKYVELKKIYHALGQPGCPSLPTDLYETPLCYQYNLKLAQKHFKKVSPSIQKKRFKFVYSKMGGADVRRGMEWVAHQWQKNLGFQVELSPIEQGMYVQTLALKKPALFRKGVALDRPTCLWALQQFQKGRSSNYIRYNNTTYNKHVEALSHMVYQDNMKSKPSLKLKQQCTKALKTLMQAYKWIPLGEMHFTMLSDNQFTGMAVNKLNQLDLTQLRYKDQK